MAKKTKLEVKAGWTRKRKQPYSHSEEILLFAQIFDHLVELEKRVADLESRTDPHRMAGYD